MIVSSAYAQEGCTLTTIGGDVIVIHDAVSCIKAMGVAVYHQFIGMPWNINAYAAGIGLGAMEYGEALVELASDPVALGGQLLGFALEVVSDPQTATLKYGAAIVNSLQAQAYGYLAAMANGNYEEAGRIGSGLAIDIVIKIVAPAAGTGLAIVSASSPIGKLVDRLTGPGGANRGTVAHYGPLNQGPLPYDIVRTFRSGTYNEVVTVEATTLYRVISDNGNPGGESIGREFGLKVLFSLLSTARWIRIGATQQFE